MGLGLRVCPAFQGPGCIWFCNLPRGYRGRIGFDNVIFVTVIGLISGD